MTRLNAIMFREYTDKHTGEVRKVSTVVGSAFPLKDKPGYSVVLNAIPIPQDGELRFVLMEPLEPREQG